MSWLTPHEGRPGRPPVFSDAAIHFCLSIIALFKLPLRQTAGVVASLLRLSGLNWSYPDFSTLCRRQKTLAVQIPYRRVDGPLNLLVDSTGIKFLGDGEWQARKHGVQGRRQWRKVHLTQDRFYPVCRPDCQDGAFDLKTATLFECSGLTGTWDAWFKSQARPFDRWAEVNRGSTFGIAVNVALEGARIAMMHDTLVADMIADGRLLRPFNHAPPLSEGYYLIHPARTDQTAASRAFAKWPRARTKWPRARANQAGQTAKIAHPQYRGHRS